MRLIILFLTVITAFSLQAQTASDSLVLYTPEFDFKEGVYASFEDVRHNNPLPKNRIFSEYNYSDNDFYDKILQKKNLYYFDNLGNRLEFKTKNIWGYSRNGFLYIQIDGSFFRISMVGSISHFVALKTYETYPRTPYYNSYYSPYSYHSTPRQETEMKQYLLDFSSGDVFPYGVESIEILLMKDAELAEEFANLRRRKKKQLLFVYLRKFNERNPLYIINK